MNNYGFLIKWITKYVLYVQQIFRPSSEFIYIIGFIEILVGFDDALIYLIIVSGDPRAKVNVN